MIVHFLQRIAKIPKRNLFCAMISGQKAMERLSEINLLYAIGLEKWEESINFSEVV